MRDRAIARLTTLLLVTLLGAFAASAESPKLYDGVHHRLSAELRPAYNIITHYALRNDGDQVNKSISLHLRYGFSFNPESRLGELFPTAYQGIGLATYSYLHHDITGTPVALYIFQGARIANLTERLSLGYEWNLGFSYGWHPNDAMSSRGNVVINLALPVAYQINNRWELTLTPDFTHFSNGDTSFPNTSSNLLGVRLGATYHFTEEPQQVSARRFIVASNELSTKPAKERISYDIMLYGAWRADRFIDQSGIHIINKALPIAGLQFQPTYHLNDYFGLGASLDLQYDRSLNITTIIGDSTDKTETYSYPPLGQQIEAGISLRGEISAPIFSIGVGLGVNMLNRGYDSSRIYTSFTLKAHLTRRLMLYIGYRFNQKQYTHNLMYGLGVRL